MKDSVKSVVVLTAICLIVSALLAATNLITAPRIAENQAKKAQASLLQVLPGATEFEEMQLPSGAPATVTALHRDKGGNGYAILLSTSTQYSKDSMLFTLGVGADGTVTGLVVTQYMESKDFGKTTYPATFIGQNSALSDVTLVAGVTYSSAALRDAVAEAMAMLVAEGLIREGQKTEAQLIGEMQLLALPGCKGPAGTLKLTDITVSGTYIEAAYEAPNQVGYLYTLRVGETALVCAVNAFGDAVCLDLEGNDVTANAAYADAIAEAKSAKPAASAALEAAHTTYLKMLLKSDCQLTPKAIAGVFGTVCAFYELSGTDSAARYAIFTRPLSYKNTALEILYLLDENGAIVSFQPLNDELIVYPEHFDSYTLDLPSYKQGLAGITSSTLTDDLTLIAGATDTTKAVRTATRDAFAAFAKWKGDTQ